MTTFSGGKPKRFVAERVLDMFARMYHLTPFGKWGYKNEAGEPVRVRTSVSEAGERTYRLGRFQLAKNVHERLLKENGHYLFITYRLNSCGTAIVINHAMHPASKFDVSECKVGNVHPRDVFDEVEG